MGLLKSVIADARPAKTAASAAQVIPSLAGQKLHPGNQQAIYNESGNNLGTAPTGGRSSTGPVQTSVFQQSKPSLFQSQTRQPSPALTDMSPRQGSQLMTADKPAKLAKTESQRSKQARTVSVEQPILSVGEHRISPNKQLGKDAPVLARRRPAPAVNKDIQSVSFYPADKHKPSNSNISVRIQPRHSVAGKDMPSERKAVRPVNVEATQVEPNPLPKNTWHGIKASSPVMTDSRQQGKAVSKKNKEQRPVLQQAIMLQADHRHESPSAPDSDADQNFIETNQAPTTLTSEHSAVYQAHSQPALVKQASNMPAAEPQSPAVMTNDTLADLRAEDEAAQQHQSSLVENQARLLEAKTTALIDDQLSRLPMNENYAARPAAIEVNQTPEVRIGRVDVFVEKAATTAQRTSSSPRPSVALASRYYLRRL